MHQQGPAPQQFEVERLGYVVAAVGNAMPEVAFSSLMASQDFLKSPMAAAFTRAYRRARSWVRSAPAEEIAEREAALFPGTSFEALSRSIARYQQLGCWKGDLQISRQLYDQSLKVFRHIGAVSTQHPYEAVVVPPPA